MIRTILCLSDTHNRHRSLRNLPQADALVHCGDFTEYGTEAEALDFLNWFCDQPYLYKLFTVGNHDVCLYGGGVEGLDGNCYFLSGNGVTLDGVHFHGLPFFIEGLENHSVQAVPSGVDVLISHQPPFGVLDEAGESGKVCHYGSESLAQRIHDIRPSYCLFGHVHAGYGMTEKDGTVYVNAALMRDGGQLNEPVLVRIGEMR